MQASELQLLVVQLVQWAMVAGFVGGWFAWLAFGMVDAVAEAVIAALDARKERKRLALDNYRELFDDRP